MKKSVYSLVLMDDVIKAVDQQAYKLGTSRSNLINQILAQHLSCTTPEMRMRNIFNSFSDLLDSCFQLQSHNSDSLITIRTALQYRYNPTINYKVELLRTPDDYLGCLKVRIRTQSSNLIDLFADFFTFWTDFEISCIGSRTPAEYSAEIDNGKFSRMLFNPKNISEEDTGKKIYSYISLLDRFIKLYFSDQQNFESQKSSLEIPYSSLMLDNII